VTVSGQWLGKYIPAATLDLLLELTTFLHFVEHFCPLTFSFLRLEDKILWAPHVEYQKQLSSFPLEYAGENICS
jgi:hypothetical protein